MCFPPFTWPKIHGFPWGSNSASPGKQRKGEVRKAEAMFRAMLEWRHSFGVDVPWNRRRKGWFWTRKFVFANIHMVQILEGFFLSSNVEQPYVYIYIYYGQLHLNSPNLECSNLAVASHLEPRRKSAAGEESLSSNAHSEVSRCALLDNFL